MPKYEKMILCLANSRKHQGRCLAGIEVDDIGAGNGWVRPVSTAPTGEISEEDRRFKDGTDPKVLDVIRIQMLNSQPHTFQTENHLIDAGYYWRLERTATYAEAAAHAETHGPDLWAIHNSSYSGQNDRVPVSSTDPAQGSLRLIQVSDLTLRISAEGAAFGNPKRKVRGRFTFNGVQYALAVTDPVTERAFLAGDDGDFMIGSALMCVSLGEPHDGYAYKLIASILTAPL